MIATLGPAEGDSERYQDNPSESADESSEDEYQITDRGEDIDCFNGDALQQILTSAKASQDAFSILTQAKVLDAFSGAHLKNLQGLKESQRTKERRVKEAKDWVHAAKNTRSLLDMGFHQSRPQPEVTPEAALSKEELCAHELKVGIKALEKNCTLGLRRRY